MKAIIGLIVVLQLVIASYSYGEMKNGYTDIDGAKSSLISVNEGLDGHLSLVSRMYLKKMAKSIEEYITYYELTENLIIQFKIISPDLYNRIDGLRDYKSRVVDVYIKVVPESELTLGVAAVTNLNQSNDDPHMYISEYGENTVEVRVRTDRRALHLLAHELGHVHYQVPNLCAYIQFHEKYYSNTTRKSIGHNDGDPSGAEAVSFSLIFREEYIKYIRKS